MKPVACPQIITDFGELISNGSEMNKRENMTHIHSIFITAGNLQRVCETFLGSEGNLETAGRSQSYRE